MNLFTPGKFRARAVHGTADLGKTGNQKDQISITFKLKEGPDEGRLIPWYGFFTAATQDGTIDAMRNAGWRGDDIRRLESIGDEQASDVELVIQNEPNLENETRSRVRYVNRVARPALKSRMSDSERDDLAKRMRGALVEHNLKNRQSAAMAKPSRAVPQHQESSGGTDDIPF